MLIFTDNMIFVSLCYTDIYLDVVILKASKIVHFGLKNILMKMSTDIAQSKLIFEYIKHCDCYTHLMT